MAAGEGEKGLEQKPHVADRKDEGGGETNSKNSYIQKKRRMNTKNSLTQGRGKRLKIGRLERTRNE